eukprot:augustus_masked-scaffold_7-processed-gene-2.9-mRNA-1 protein AED:0.06 eAED:0.06 QI:0/-1/0/1/-1/1/1/0/547
MSLDDVFENFQFNNVGWGPTTLPEKYVDMPFSSFGYGDRIGKAADFVGKVQSGYGGSPSGMNDDDFNVVDTSKVRKEKTFFKPNWARSRGRQTGPARRNKDVHKPQPKGKQLKYLVSHTKRGKQWRRPRNMGNRGNRRRAYSQKNASVAIDNSWELVEQFDLVSLTKLQVQPPSKDDIEEIRTVGSLRRYDEKVDKIKVKTAKTLDTEQLSQFENPNRTTKDDPVLRKIAYETRSKKDTKVSVFITDEILSMLMVAPRSYFPWDVVITKMPDGMVFVDKRPDDEILSTLTVHEAPIALNDGEETVLEPYNEQEQLNKEATMINEVFRQQVLVRKATTEEDKKKYAPKKYKKTGEDELDEAIDAMNIAYKYRKFKLSTMDVYVRTEVHAMSKVKNQKKQATVFALNEWDSKLAKGVEWRTRVDGQRGGLLATEMKTNSCKLSRWAVRSILAGTEVMKVGFVSRKARHDPNNHVILGAQVYDPLKFGAQINLLPKNMWGIFKGLLDFVAGQDAGNYILLKDPNKGILRFYRVSKETDDEEEDSSDEDED